MTFHERAGEALRELAGARAWGLPWPVAHEFVCAVTRPGYFTTPTPTEVALDFIARLLVTSGAQPLGYGSGHWGRLVALAVPADARGYGIYDARIAAICLAHGVRELWTADRDFGRFPSLKVRNPLVLGSA